MALLAVALAEVAYGRGEAASSCRALASLTLPDSQITNVTSVPAEMAQVQPGLPPFENSTAFCRVEATLRPTTDSEIRVEVWLPTEEQWNGKFEGVGNVGLAGTLFYSGMIPGLLRGYAVAVTDTGHDNLHGSGAFALGHAEKVSDYGFRATHLTASFGKAIVERYYRRSPTHAYFSGCSQGGQEAMMEVQRFPMDYDGVISGDPAMYQTHHEVGAHLWIPLTLAATEGNSIPMEKAELVGRAVNEACDALDGVRDGVLEDPRRCHFEPATLQCKGPDAPDCLTASQVRAIEKIWEGPREVLGAEYYPGLERGAEADTWKNFVYVPASGVNSHDKLGLPFFRYFVFSDPNWEAQSFNFLTDPTLVDGKLALALDAMNPDLGPFKRRGGKLIQYHGFNDADVPPRVSINYYESVAKLLGGPDQVDSFYRLFMVPGMGHCTGGPGANSFDPLSALEQWVERGTPPDKIIATKYTNDNPKLSVVRTHPLCPYPQTAHYNGAGNAGDAANFVCGLDEGAYANRR